MESVKETKELLAGVKEAAKLGKKVRDIVKDGVDASDLPKAFGLFQEQSGKLGVYSLAIADVEKVKSELQDLDKAEIIELLMEVVSAISEVEAV
jgi:putative ubiquitin-RnfH superfamily antitoxin RatB of RatAB toxin-antitoxin module